MPEFFVNGQPVRFEKGQTVMQAALAAGFYIPYFCWHPNLSVAGNCRICMVEVEGEGGGSSWMDIACNMPVTEGMRVLTDSEAVRARRKEILQFILLNHPVDCGVCDKAGECVLQDYHYEYNGEPSVSNVPKVHATKFHPLSSRIILDNERCIVCSRCVRFTREVSKSHGLGILDRGDTSLVRATGDGRFERDPYSDNVIDICPVGALLSRQFLYKARVWYLKPTPSVCPGCSRGCAIDIWHRKPEWKLNALDPKLNARIERVTPHAPAAPRGGESHGAGTEVAGPWICNKARDLARILERPRAEQAMLKGKPVELAVAIEAARRLIADARRPVALVSSWGSNEELDAFKAALGGRVECFVKIDHQPAPGEVVEDDFLIRADKNPNTRHARALFGDRAPQLGGADLVIVWGEGFDFARLPRGAKVVFLNSYLAPENGHADAFIPISVQTERAGHYTNFEGAVRRFERCFARKPTVADAEQVFARIGQSLVSFA
ncbi:MAG: 2Fe-2S iron-sulfur cluster-binding protein [Burkholderiaceae bacterium]|nr:2Fe-2S iron-sulfur cluster-binding protein [Burkholderiaceae bacterium]